MNHRGAFKESQIHILYIQEFINKKKINQRHYLPRERPWDVRCAGMSAHCVRWDVGRGTWDEVKNVG